MSDYLSKPESTDFMDIIEHLLECASKEGMVPPFIVCVLCTTGSVAVVRIRALDNPSEMLVDHSEPEGFRGLPTFTLIDQNNKALHLSLIERTSDVCSSPHAEE